MCVCVCIYIYIYIYIFILGYDLYTLNYKELKMSFFSWSFLWGPEITPRKGGETYESERDVLYTPALNWEAGHTIKKTIWEKRQGMGSTKDKWEAEGEGGPTGRCLCWVSECSIFECIWMSLAHCVGVGEGKKRNLWQVPTLSHWGT